MTVKELKEKLEQFPENLIVLIPNTAHWLNPMHENSYVQAEHVSKGINELDGCIIIDDYIEDED